MKKLKNVNVSERYTLKILYFGWVIQKKTMSAKTISIIVLTVLVTVILMKNMDEVNFWIFGTRSVPKLAVLGTMFFTGAVVGFLVGRPKRKYVDEEPEADGPAVGANRPLDDADEDYIN